MKAVVCAVSGTGSRDQMRPARRQPDPSGAVTLADVAHRAVEVCDPDGTDDALGDFLRWFEDRDEPITALARLDEDLAEASMAVDPEGDDPAVAMAAAVVAYLAHRRDELEDNREDVLRLAARAEFDGDPPPELVEWLAAEGIEV